MEQLSQLTRCESESFTELPSYLKDKLDFGDDFDLFSPCPSAGHGDPLSGGLQSLSDPQSLLLPEEAFAVPKISDRSPFQRIRALNHLENIVEEESYELDTSKFTERLESFNELVQYSYRKARRSKDYFMEECTNSKKGGVCIDYGIDHFAKVLPSPQSLAQSARSNKFVFFQATNVEYTSHKVNESNEKEVHSPQLSPEPRIAKRDFQSSLQFMRQSRSGEEKALLQNDSTLKQGADNHKTEEAFQINRIATSNSENENNFSSEDTDPNLKSTINIYQNNNIVINITNDNSKTFNSVKKTVNNSVTKNVYYDFQKIPTNVFSKKKAESSEASPQDSHVKTKLASNTTEVVFAKTQVASEKKRGSKLRVSDRSEPFSSSNLDKKYRNSKLLQQSSPEGESMSSLMMKSDFFSTARQPTQSQRKVLDMFASTHSNDGFAFKANLGDFTKNLEHVSKLNVQEESSRALFNLYRNASNFSKKPNSSAKLDLVSSQTNLKQPVKEYNAEILRKFKEFKEVHEKNIASSSHKTDVGNIVPSRNIAKRVSAIVPANNKKKTNTRSKSITPNDTSGMLFDSKLHSKKSQLGAPFQTQSQILRPVVSETHPPVDNIVPHIKSSFCLTGSKFYSEKFISLASSQTFLNTGVPTSLQHSSILTKPSSGHPKDNTAISGKQPANVNRGLSDFPGVGPLSLFRTGVFENQQERSRRSKTKGPNTENIEPEFKGLEKTFKAFHIDSTGSLQHSKTLKQNGKGNLPIKLRGILDAAKSSTGFMPSNPELQKILGDNQRIYNKAKKILKY
jgi:hypothetical protein